MIQRGNALWQHFVYSAICGGYHYFGAKICLLVKIIKKRGATGAATRQRQRRLKLRDETVGYTTSNLERVIYISISANTGTTLTSRSPPRASCKFCNRVFKLKYVRASGEPPSCPQPYSLRLMSYVQHAVHNTLLTTQLSHITSRHLGTQCIVPTQEAPVAPIASVSPLGA